MRKLLNVSLILLAVTCHASVANAQLKLSSMPNKPGEATLFYDPTNGNLSIHGGGTALTTIEIKSPSGWFIAENVTDGLLVPPWDSISANKFFTLKVDGAAPGPWPHEIMNMGNILPLDLTSDQLLTEFAGDVESGDGANTVKGSFLGGGAMNPNGHTNLCCVPEPGSSVLFCIGALCLWPRVRRRSGHNR